MPSSTNNVKLGVCKIYFDGVDLGYTQGGVEFMSATETHRVEIDQFGKTAIKETIIGRSCGVKVPLAETTLTNLAALFPVNPNSIQFGGGLVGTSKQRVGVDAGVGLDLLATAKVMIIHPFALLDSDFSDEIIIPLANTPGALTFAYKLEEERIFNVDYTGYPDPTSGMLFFAGNPFTDAVGKTFAVTAIAGATALTSAAVPASINGKLAILGPGDNAATTNAPGYLFRKGYYVKFISATSVQLFLDAALTQPGPAVGTGGITGPVNLAILA